jgi:hypothetical protein
MIECNSIGTPVATRTKLTKKKGDRKLIELTIFKNIVGSLKYLIITRPNIVYGVGLVSRYMKESKSTHQLVAK